ncbi:hypothetical protein LSM04_006239 [Trypanosoma melophagium]|uniref:uncharacterized protein n=1 Tax=Trypanosoma melophagium TaxID=715481 RepID=UPI003519E937|nr:hypothetical protein LSM04_006239 [Trypanosoma melophagium]
MKMQQNVERESIYVLLASGELASVGVPIVFLSITVNNGNDSNNNNTLLQYRLKVQEFHQWRFTMARVVRDLIYLEKKDALATRIETTETLRTSSAS